VAGFVNGATTISNAPAFGEQPPQLGDLRGSLVEHRNGAADRLRKAVDPWLTGWG
jgi:hypothetical protein